MAFLKPGIRDMCEWPGSFLRSEWEQPTKVLGQGGQRPLWFPVLVPLLPGTWTQTHLLLLPLLFFPGLSEVPAALGGGGVGACALRHAMSTGGIWTPVACQAVALPLGADARLSSNLPIPT